MREIKFRAWNIENANMIDGKDFYLCSQGPAIVMINDPLLTPLFQGGKDDKIQGDGYWFMQYTGLKDKNGKEIFEGDVVAIDMWQGNEHGYIPEDGVIKWHDESSAFKWFSGDPSDGNNYWLSNADEKQRQVIGNIHENLELLK